MSKPFVWLGPARLPFLVLTPACIMLGVACVQWTHGQVNLLEALLVLLGAMAVGCLAVSIGVGLYFVVLRGAALLPLGMAGVALVPTALGMLLS